MEIPSTEALAPQQQEAYDDILGLIALQKTTGFMTYKTQREILCKLSPHDAAVVGRALAKRVQPICTERKKEGAL
jgi:hypothetical protein